MIHNPKEEGDLYWSISDPNQITMVMLVKNEYQFSNYVQVLNTRTVSIELVSIYKLFTVKEHAEEAAKTAFESGDDYIYYNDNIGMWVTSYDPYEDCWDDMYAFEIQSEYLSDEFYLEFEMANRR